jgi:hypothetical protein
MARMTASTFQEEYRHTGLAFFQSSHQAQPSPYPLRHAVLSSRARSSALIGPTLREANALRTSKLDQFASAGKTPAEKAINRSHHPRTTERFFRFATHDNCSNRGNIG